MYIVLIFKTGDEYVEERDGRRDEYTPGVVYNVTLGKLRENSNEKEREALTYEIMRRNRPISIHHIFFLSNFHD